AVDASGTVFVADTANSTIRAISPSGQVTTFAGTAGGNGNADGHGASATFFGPTGLAFDSHGNLYVADPQNSPSRKITPDGSVTTIAGTAGQQGIVLGSHPGLASPISLVIVGDSILITDTNALLLLEHAAQ